MKAATANAKKKDAKPSGLDLGSLGDMAGLLSDAPEVKNTGAPLMIDLARIHEDPNQPRTEDNPGFSPESLGEMAVTIRTRGVKTPISVREHPEIDGDYIINHGARRTRASKLAGMAQIPAFIDNDYAEVDQVIENLQRDALTAREIADWIGRELAKGKKKGDIAKEMGKSASFVSQHVTLLDLPDAIAEAFNTGRVRDVTVINELVTAHKKKPAEVESWLEDDTQEITRGSVKLLREFLDEKTRDPKTVDFINGQTDEEGTGGGTGGGEAAGGGDDKAPTTKDEKPADPTKLKKAIVQVEHYGRPARLVLNRRPTEVGLAWFKYDDDGAEFEAAITEAKLVAVIEG